MTRAKSSKNPPTLRKMQPALLHVPMSRDVESTPLEIVEDMLGVFQPAGRCLDPCAGDSMIFYNNLPIRAEWCEIERGRDFYACTAQFDWIVGNPPYSHYSAWLRHSLKLAENVLYLMPLYKIFSSAKMQDDLFAWGGIVHIRRYGTGTQWGFPFGHALAAAHFQCGYRGSTRWTKYGALDYRDNAP